MLDDVLFIAFPYVAIVLAVGGGIYRYNTDRFSYSSQSSQLLENRWEFWGSVPWHYGIVLILLAHLLAFLLPGLWASMLSVPIGLYILEISGLALALITLLGLAILIIRRISNLRVRAVTTVMDWILLAALFIQVGFGFWVAFFYRWGSDWFLHTAVPWLVSLVILHPTITFVTGLPGVVQFHMLFGFVIILLFPFTRLVHLVTVPVEYLWRPYQVVIWNRRVPAAGTARNRALGVAPGGS